MLALQDIYDRLFDPAAEIADSDRLELAGDDGAPPVLPQILNPDHYAPELARDAGVPQRRRGRPPPARGRRDADGHARDPQAAARRR